MKLNFFAFVFAIVHLSLAQAAPKTNLCDTIDPALVDSIKACQNNPKYGVSEYAKEQAAKKALELQASKAASEVESQQNGNIIIKKFSADELLEASYGKPFISVRLDYNFNPVKEKKMTEGTALCKFLGFEKAIKSEYSDELSPTEADKKGLIISTSILGVASKVPEVYTDEKLSFAARKYVSIACVKRKDPKMEGSSEVLKKYTEAPPTIVPQNRIGTKNPHRPEVDDRSREAKKGTTYGFKDPYEDDAKAEQK